MLPLVILAGLTASPGCTADSIAHIERRQHTMPGYGPEIITQAGRDFFSLRQDATDPRDWREGDALQVCPEPDVPRWAVRGYRITNLPREENLAVDEPK